MIGELGAAWELWLRFAAEVGAIRSSEQSDLENRGRNAFAELVVAQSPFQHASNPALRFRDLVRTGMADGSAHVTDRQGRAPECPQRWGWRRRSNGTWTPQGTRIGWIVGEDLYLDPEASYRVAQKLAGKEGLTLSMQTLRQRMRDEGLLASVDEARNMLVVRRIFEGVSHKVLHLRRDLVV